MVESVCTVPPPLGNPPALPYITDATAVTEFIIDSAVNGYLSWLSWQFELNATEKSKMEDEGMFDYIDNSNYFYYQNLVDT